ncbi:17-beta-hydroxysteroid dehydrogenase 13-like [Uranotaenia lowii]|uniref:17-beta-hydroxysteroid dehydrogenase 13-like n=1 Tax=Uranotaenia lowii TaxID=190385 RepID=UPI00247A2546|nr:17-beta-hydroxysteroid dehydrogenase 13-like [Uranotaenia lowii]XP_055610117.1 17-beta-hydroxysteroid dehydrogenase 13-like [Uranotaenia lowii]
MQSIQNIGSTPYVEAPRGQQLRSLMSRSRKGPLRKIFAITGIVLSILWEVLRLVVSTLISLVRAPVEKDISGQLALVTGGANGLGKEICLLLAGKRCNVAVADLDTLNGEKTAEELRQLGVKSQFFKVDISQYESVQELKQQIESTLGDVDIVVNNAGVMPLFSVREGTADQIRKTMDINLLAHFWTTRAFLDGMISRRRGHIVGIASATSFFPVGRICAYVSSKYGARGFMDALHEELFYEGLEGQVNSTAVYPMFMNTRREVTDVLQKLNMLGRIPMYSARYSAKLIVRGLIRNQRQVFIPKRFGILMREMEAIPLPIKRIIQKVYFKMPAIPNLTS